MFPLQHFLSCPFPSVPLIQPAFSINELSFKTIGWVVPTLHTHHSLFPAPGPLWYEQLHKHTPITMNMIDMDPRAKGNLFCLKVFHAKFGHSNEKLA